MRRFVQVALIALSFVWAQACSYGLKRTQSSLLESEKIRTIFVNPVINNSFKTGVEVVVYNAIQKEFLRIGNIHITRDLNEADAVLVTSVESAQYSIHGTTSTINLQPQGLGDKDRYVATDYTAVLSCQFNLRRNKKITRELTKTVWSGGFSRSKFFGGNNQLGNLGTTSALINESEFDRALDDLSKQILSDASENMLAAF